MLHAQELSLSYDEMKLDKNRFCSLLSSQRRIGKATSVLKQASVLDVNSNNTSQS